MNFFKYLKSKFKYLFGIAAMAALLSQILLPALSATADGPQFNFLQGDQELLRGANVTQNESVWHNPVSGNAGDIFRGIVYYHNGFVNTTAENTKIKVNIPASTTNNKVIITASISADNAATVTDTVVDGQIVGLHGLNVNLNQDADLLFVPGSVRWFPDSNQNGGPNEQPQTLPNGQTGNEIVSDGGVNIGGVQGCWNFAGFITFDFKTTPKTAPALNIEKMVRNVSAGQNDFVKQTNAQIGDEVQYEVEPSNTGNVDLPNAILKDQLPAGIEFESGTFSLKSDGKITPISDSDAAQFFDGGLNIGTLKVGQNPENNQFMFNAKVTDKTNCDDLVNTAIVTAAGLTAKASANVELVKPNIVKSKSAFNDTQNAPAGTVNPNDLITYTLTTKNTGTAATKFVVSDDISQVLKFADIVKISDGGKVTDDGLISWPEININPGQTIVDTFQVKVKDSASDSCFTNVYGNAVTICVAKKVAPILNINKLVRDVTTNENDFVKSNQAFAGDTLEYLINFSNTGNGEADKITFTDSLPPNTQYVPDSTVVSWNGNTPQALPDGITGAGVSISKIEVGETGFIKFRVTIATGVEANQVLVNTAFLTQNGNTISSTAQTTIIAKSIPQTLPKTGGTAGASFLLTLFSGIGLLYVKYRKIMNGQDVAIINQLLSR